MSSPRHLADALDDAAGACRTADVDDWSPDDFDTVLRGLNTVTYEVAGLAERIRAAKHNNTDPPHPVKPLNPQPKPAPQPKPPPPPPPPARPGGK